MSFPVYIPVFGHRLHPHPVMEVLAYAAGSQLYFLLRRRWRGPMTKLPMELNLWLLVGCIFGALFGSKLLAWAESWPHYREALRSPDPRVILAGKTIVGGLLGGWVGIEVAKKLMGITRSTGDLFVFPLIVGMSIGRVGCFLTGLDDHTHGNATGLPWGVDFGDGVRRHPAQLYEIAFLLALGLVLICTIRRGDEPGRLFRRFMLGYLLLRLLVEWIKPTYKPHMGLSAIQLACLAGAAVCLWQLTRRPQPEALSEAAHESAPAPKA
jgi:prolipoprotein diacylglyceryltransferase